MHFQNNNHTPRLKKFTFLRGGNSEVVFSQKMSEFFKGKKGRGQGLLHGCYKLLIPLQASNVS